MAITYEMYLKEEARIAEWEAWWEEHQEEFDDAWNAAEEAREKIYTKFPDVDFTPYKDYKTYSDWYDDENLKMIIDEDEQTIIYNKHCEDYFGTVVIKKPFGKLKEDIERRFYKEDARIAELVAWMEEREEEIDEAWNAAEEAREKIYTKFPDVDFTPYKDYKTYSDWYDDENLKMIIDEDSQCIIYNKKCEDFFADVVIKKPFGKLKEDIERRFYGRFTLPAGAQA